MRCITRFLWKEQNLRGFLILSILVNLGYSVTIYSSAEVLKQATGIIESGLVGQLQSVILFAAVTTVLFIILGVALRILKQMLINRASESIEGKLLEHLYQLPKQRRVAIGSGSFHSKMTSNTAAAVQGSYAVAFRFFEGLFTVLFGIVYMFLMSPILAGLFLLYNIIFRLATRPYDEKLRNTAKKGVKIRNRNTSFTMEMLKNTTVLRVFRCFPFFEKRYEAYETDEQQNNLKAFMLQNGYDEIMWLSKKLTEIVLPFGLGAILMANGYLSFAQIIAFTVANDLFSKGFNNLINMIIEANTCIPHIEAITDFLKETPEEMRVSSTGSNNALCFEDVTFSYDDEIILDNVNFSVKAGDWVQIIGPNGQGKSTLLQLIAGFYQPKSGQIFFGGGEKQLGYIPQFPELIPAGVYENLALEKSPDTVVCKDILQKLNMEQVDLLAPQYYSQGEKQRLMIGREIYHLPQHNIVLGDEIFANIDKQNRSEMAAYLKKELTGKTVFLVCHEEMGLPFDRTLVVENRTVAVVERSETV